MAINSKRISQEDRRHQMRSRLIDATLECLDDYGYHGSSLTRILDKAGVSRGAWRHHYSSKKKLIADAARESLFRCSMEKAGKLNSGNDESDDMVSGLLDFIWKNFYQGLHRNIWIELTVASRTDLELREELADVFKEFVEHLNEIWRTHFKTRYRTDVPVEMLMNMSLFIIGGMGLQSLVHDNPDYYNSLREQWAKILLPLIKPRD